MKKFLYLCRQNLFTMRKTLLFLTAVCFSIANANALNTNVKQELKTLEQALSQRPWIEEQKRVKIDSLNRAAALSSAPYEIYKQLYEEYRSYNYDTALLYVRFMEREATSDRQPEVQLSRAFVYLSGGLFKEASDILEQPALAFHLSPFAFHLSPFAFQPTDLTREYLTTRVRLLWDLADNAGGEIGETYNAEGLRLNREQQRYLSPADTAQYWYSAAMIDLREGNYPRAIERLQVSLAATQPSVHYRAMVASTLAYAYRMTGNNDAALHYYIDAAVSDIRSSTYETVALRNIAEILFEDGETTLADRYIHLAMQDATRYHARHRQVSIAQSLPIIEERMMSLIRQQQRIAWILLIVVAILLALGIAAIGMLIRKNRAVHAAQDTIDRMNHSLMEANKLKEELLGTLLTSRSQFIAAVGQYQQDVKQHAVNRRWSELMSVPKNADAHMQRAVLDRQIDAIFLSIYPTFVQDFNALLRPDEQLTLKKDELLNAQLRIFALIRLGITHNEVIAQILDYSVNTVYTYKTRVIAASDLTPDAFYAALMAI